MPSVSLAPLVAGLVLALTIATGCGDSPCEELPGCTVSDCINGTNQCGGAVYQCVDGELVEGHCDHSPPDASADGPADATTDASATDAGNSDAGDHAGSDAI